MLLLHLFEQTFVLLLVLLLLVLKLMRLLLLLLLLMPRCASVRGLELTEGCCHPCQGGEGGGGL